MIQQKPDSVKTKIENLGREQTNYVTVRKVLDKYESITLHETINERKKNT